VLFVGAAVSFLTSHIYWPRGVITMVFLAVGVAALSLAQDLSAPEAARGHGAKQVSTKRRVGPQRSSGPVRSAN